MNKSERSTHIENLPGEDHAQENTGDKVVRHSRKLVYVSGALLRDGEAFLLQHAQYEENGMAGYGDFLFTTDAVDKCDGLVIFNTPSEPLSVKTPPNNVIALMMEPGHRFIHPWMYSGLDSYAKVYSPRSMGSNVVASHGFLGWSVNKSLRELIQMSSPEKMRSVSCVLSDAHVYTGHRKRLGFVYDLIKNGLRFDLIGKGFRPVDDKWKALESYRFSIALENEEIPHYFTEKITDCFLAWTIPVYWGCTNLEEYFPSESFIRIDIEKPDEAAEIILSLDEREYRNRYPALVEARQLVMEKYQPLAKISEVLSSGDSEPKSDIRINPVLPNSLLKKIYGNVIERRNLFWDQFIHRYDLPRMRQYANRNLHDAGSFN